MQLQRSADNNVTNVDKLNEILSSKIDLCLVDSVDGDLQSSVHRHCASGTGRL